jgi:hypothetical protein
MKAVFSVLTALSPVLMLLNMFGAVIAGIWLAVLGKWSVIGWGILGLIISPTVLTVALIPSFGLGLGAFWAAKRHSRVGLLGAGFVGFLYVALIMTAWSIAVMLFFIARADHRSWIPVLLWSYSAATGPWAYMASHDSQNSEYSASAMAVIFAQLGYVAMMALLAFAHPTILDLLLSFAVPVLFCVFIQTRIAALLTGEPSFHSDMDNL